MTCCLPQVIMPQLPILLGHIQIIIKSVLLNCCTVTSSEAIRARKSVFLIVSRSPNNKPICVFDCVCAWAGRNCVRSCSGTLVLSDHWCYGTSRWPPLDTTGPGPEQITNDGCIWTWHTVNRYPTDNDNHNVNMIKL